MHPKALGHPGTNQLFLSASRNLRFVRNKFAWVIIYLMYYFNVTWNSKFFVVCDQPFVRSSSNVGLQVMQDPAPDNVYPRYLFGTVARISCPIGFRLTSTASSWNTTFSSSVTRFMNISCLGSLGWPERPFDINCSSASQYSVEELLLILLHF